MTTDGGQSTLDELLKRQREYENSVEPLDISVMLGDRVVTVRLPYLKPPEFGELTNKHSPHILYRDAIGCWFDVDAVARDYPDVVLLDGDQEDNLYELRGKEGFYRWPEVYDALTNDDKGSIQAGIWGLYIHEPAERKRKAVASNG